jgi:hypothetical protein
MLHVEAYLEKQQAEVEEKITLVWLGEYYHRIKKLPTLKKILSELKQDKNLMTSDEMLAKVKQLHTQFGGEIVSAEMKEGD